MSSNEPLLRAAVLILLALLVLPVLMMFVLLPMMGFTGWSHMSGPGMWNGGGGGGWIAVLLTMGVPLVLVIALGYAVYRLLTKSEDRTDDALEELRMTYARGDLSDEEFEKRRDRLQREK
jgi:putative membrane protein